MKYVLLAGFVSTCTLAAQPGRGAGSIEGHVFNSLTSAPVRKATVTLTTPQIQLVADTPAFEVERITYDAKGAFEYALSTMRADRYEIRSTLYI